MSSEHAPSVFIPDGYNFKGKVEGRPGLWPEVNFQYRPALPAAHAEYIAQSRRTGEEVASADVSLLVKHLQSWDAALPDGTAIPLKADSLRKCYPPILAVMVNHVLSYTVTKQEDDAKNSVSASG